MSALIGDDCADDSDALQGAIDEAAASGETLHLKPKATYKVTREIVVSENVDIEGHGASIDAFVPMRSVLALKSTVYLNNLTVNGGRVAEHALYCDGAGESYITRSTFMMAVKDAARLDGGAANGGNDCMVFERCKFQHSGRTFSSGTIVVEAGGSALVHGTGTSFVTWGVRPGDFINAGGARLAVAAVFSETEAQLAGHPSVSAYSGPFSVGVGNGYREESDHDNNLVTMRNCLTRGNAGSGARFAGLYGACIEAHRSDFNGDFGFVVGLTGDTSNVIGSAFRSCYTEDNGAAPFWLGYAAGITIDTLLGDGAPFVVSNPSFNWGEASNIQSLPNVGRIPIGNTCSDVPSRATFAYDTPPAPAHGRIAFKYAPGPGDCIGWVCIGLTWYKFGQVLP